MTESVTEFLDSRRVIVNVQTIPAPSGVLGAA